MPSSPRKPVKNEVMLRGIVRSNSDDSDDSDDLLPSLISCSDDEDPDEDDNPKKTTSKAKVKGKETVTTKPKINGECVDKWYKLSKADKDKNIHVMKIYLLSPFLFGQVYQDDKWINWAFECGLLPSKSSFEIRDVKEEYLDAVDLVESAFAILTENVLWKNKDGLLKTLETITKVNMSQHLDKAITCAESFLSFTSVRDILRLKSGMSKKQGDIALLFAHNQVCDHVKQLAAGENLVEDFGKRCKDEEDQSAENKKKGNDDFSNGRYAAAISKYSLALHVSPYNHVLYGNRAQSFLKTNEFGHALADGRRAAVLKADWHKAQYRYAQAFFELGFYDKAKEVNRAARKICSEKKDLDSQYDKFIKSIQTAIDSRGKITGKRTSQTGVFGRKSSIGSDTEDLPELVDADTSDTSRSDDERLGEDKMPGLVDLESQEETDDSCNSDGEGVLLHQSESSHESDSDDLASRSRRRRTVPYLEHRRNRQDKARKYPHDRQEKEKEMKKKKSKLSAKIKEQNKVTRKELSNELQRKRELNDWLTQGTKALQEKKSVTAARSYGEALRIVEQYSYQLLEMKEIDFVILLYSHGTACLHTGTHEDLQVAMKQFQIIILQYKHIDFPLAYYGEGSVLYKQNRFAEALVLLERGLALVKKLGDALGTYRWPASQVIIDESKPGKSLNIFETLIRICKHPPRPDAICRYSDCTSKTQVYLTDPDYKGFIRLICHENCKVEFHPVCWKKLKSSDSGKAGDKDFIEDECMTPDCGGFVTNIQIFDAEGLKTEFNSEKANSKLEAKTKPAKQAKVKHSGAFAKQRKKKGKDVFKVDQPVPADSNEEKQHAAYHLQVNNTPFSTVHIEEKPSQGLNVLAEMRGCDPFSSDVGIPPADDGVYILKKESDEDPAKSSVVKGFNKAKSKKKKIKNTRTLGEFLNDHGGHPLPLRCTIDSVDDMDEIPPPQCAAFDLVTPPPGWSQHEMEAPFAIPPHLQDEAADFEASYRAMNMFPSSSSSFSLSERPDVKNVTEYVSTLLLEILREEGALDLADPKILQPLSILADECQEIISHVGGLRPILEQSGKFVFHGNKVMLPEEKEFIKDMLQTLRPFSKGSSNETKNPFLERTFNSLDTDTSMDLSVKLQEDVSKTGIASESIWDLDDGTKGVDIGGQHVAACSSSSSLLCKPSISPRFNPDAMEFVPFVQQQMLSNTSSNTSITTVIENTCGDIESVDDQIVEQVSNVQQDVQNTNDLSLVLGVPHDIEPLVTCPTCKSETSLALGSRANGKSSETLSNFHGDLTSFVVSGEKNASLEVKDDLIQAQNLQKPNSGGEQVTNSKTKAVQTQPNVKTKGVGTDPIPEPFKAEYHRAVAEKDALQNKLQEATDRHASMRSKNTAECDKLKKKLTEALHEKEKYLKDVLDIKQKNLDEIRKLRQHCEDKDEKIKTLSQKLHEAEEKSSTVGSLKKELMSCKAQLSVEKELWMKEKSEKDDLLKNVKLQHQHQHTRAQEAEVKLLELRRDVGLRFLERAYQESHITINNLIQALNARIAGPKVEELVNTWKSYASECHQRVVQCKTTFNEQIELLKGGCTLASVPQLPIPGPPPYPAIPVLQSVVPGQQPLSHSSKESSLTNRTSAASAATVVAAAAAVPSTAAVSSAGAPSVVVSPASSNVSSNGESVPGSGSAAAADKGRPSNSFEKIMLRLSAMYPSFSRLELTGFIKEVRHNKHGSLTGLSLEDIVASVSELVEQKTKAGLLRTNNTATQRPGALTYKPTAAQPQNQQTHGVKAQSELMKMCLGRYEEDLCVICHEDMNASTDIVTLDCTHRYHSTCIRKWLLGEQSTCPTCREHALLPDEFPRLK